MDLLDAARELYAVLPKDFTSERASLVRRAKDAGSKELAKEIGALTKPSAGAWAVNMLASHQPEVIDAVVRFGASLRTAQVDGDSDALRELGQQRQGHLAAAVHAAKELSDQLGAALSSAATAEVEQTMRAAMADAGAAQAVGTCRLVKGLSGSGFESVDLTGAIAAGGPDAVGQANGTSEPERQVTVRRPAASAKEAPSSPRSEATSLAARRAAKKKAALDEAEAEFTAADHAARQAEESASSSWDAVHELTRRRSGVQDAIEDVRKKLESLEAELIGITRDQEAAESEKKLAVRAATQLRRVADPAQRRVDRLN